MACVKVSPTLITKALHHTNWPAIDAQTDAQIADNVASDPDAAPILTNAQTAAALTRTVRRRLHLSQAAFATRFHLPLGTLRDWEQNRRQPDAPALAYLRVIAHNPELVLQALQT